MHTGPYPTYSFPEFDRVLYGWIEDYQNELDMSGVKCIIDKEIDISDGLKIHEQKMESGGIRYEWECSVPEKLLDDFRHHVSLKFMGHDGIEREIFYVVLLYPVRAPKISFVVYPYRDVLKKLEDQDAPDPLKVLVVLEGRIEDEWASKESQFQYGWKIDGVPVSGNNVEINWQTLGVIINLEKPLEGTPVVEIGPIYLEDGIVMQDSAEIYFPQDGMLDSECSLDFYLEALLDLHFADETEAHAWAYEFIWPQDACPAIVTDSHHIMYPLDNDFPNQVAIEQPEDYGHFGNPIFEYWGEVPSSGQHTIRADNSNQHMFYKRIEATDGINTQPYTLQQNFPADDINPYFLETVVKTGPEASEWIIEQIARPGAEVNQSIITQLLNIKTDLCRLYVCLRTSDPGGGIAGIAIDVKDQFGQSSFGNTEVGPQMWIDHTPVWDIEIDPWNHLAYQDNVPGLYPGLIASDFQEEHEELVMVRGLDDFIDQGAQAVYFRTMDLCGNWRKTVNVIDSEFLNNGNNQLYHVEKVGIFEYDYCGVSTVETDFCNVPVQERNPSGIYVMDYSALVYAKPNFEPEYIMSRVSTPTHEGAGGSLYIDVPLYRVDPISQRYSDLCYLFDVYQDNCQINFYSRGEDLLIDGGNCPEVEISDSILSCQPIDEFDYSTIPYKFMSDRDYPQFMGTEGDYGDDRWKDYSIIITKDPDISSYYNSIIDDCYFGYNRRGLFNNCSYDGLDKENYKEDIMRCGVEEVLVNVGSEVATAPIQSRPDILFVFGHGLGQFGQYSDPVNDLHLKIGPFELAQCTSYTDDSIHVNEWAASDIGTEVDWLVTGACSVLNDASWTVWRDTLTATGKLESMCGFKNWVNHHSFPEPKEEESLKSPFFAQFSHWLTNNHQRNNSWWVHGTQSEDLAIICWMENARYWAENARMGNNDKYNASVAPAHDASAIDDTYRYKLIKTKRPNLKWVIPKYYITRQ